MERQMQKIKEAEPSKFIDIGSADIYFDIPSIPESEFQRYSENLFVEWEKIVSDTLRLNDYQLSLEVIEGSVNLKTQIITTLGLLYGGIAGYGGFIQGVETIYKHVNEASTLLTNKAQQTLNTTVTPQTSKKTGVLGEINTLFKKVQKGELTSDQATDKAKEMLERYDIDFANSEQPENMDFLNAFKKSAENLRKFPNQFPLPLDYLEMDGESLRKTREPRQTPRQRTPLTNSLSILVWRESKNGELKIEIKKSTSVKPRPRSLF
jgi:hypothetical protein